MKYLWWEKDAEENPSASPQQPGGRQLEPDPEAERKEEEARALELESKEQDLRHKEEEHEQKMRHAEELHALKVQEKGMSQAGQQPMQPVDPTQAREAAQTNTLTQYVQSKMGSTWNASSVARPWDQLKREISDYISRVS